MQAKRYTVEIALPSGWMIVLETADQAAALARFTKELAHSDARLWAEDATAEAEGEL